jgi:transcriptional regulator with XRE-family HTH domain
MERIHDSEYKNLGHNISYYRKAKGLSQIQLAEAINISRTHMSRIENSDCAVSLDVIFSIAKFLCVPLFKLFDFRSLTGEE